MYLGMRPSSSKHYCYSCQAKCSRRRGVCSSRCGLGVAQVWLRCGLGVALPRSSHVDRRFIVAASSVKYACLRSSRLPTHVSGRASLQAQLAAQLVAPCGMPHLCSVVSRVRTSLANLSLTSRDQRSLSYVQHACPCS